MSKFVAGIIAGAALGTAAGMLFGPKPGKVTRRFVAMRARQKTGDYVDALRRKMRREGDKSVGA